MIIIKYITFQHLLTFEITDFIKKKQETFMLFVLHLIACNKRATEALNSCGVISKCPEKA